MNILRTLLLYLSSATWARRIVMNLSMARRTARRFVAGETLEEAVQTTRELNQKGLLVSLDHLGESVHEEEHAVRAANDYVEMLDAIHTHQLNANVSLKPTQLGLDISEALCVQNIRCVLEKAQAVGTTVTIDMESSAHTEATLRIFRQLRQEFDNVGTVIQAYLFRTEEDMQQLATEGATIRLCKGAYKEPAHIAFPHKADVDANFVKIMQQFMATDNRQQGAFLKVATHDPNMLEATLQYVKDHDIPAEQFELQMLYGIRSTTQQELADQGYQMRVYVPYGTEWYPYFMRRLAERPANVWFLLKNLFAR